MAAFAFLVPTRAGFAAADAALREIVLFDTGVRIPDNRRLVAQWQHGADGRLVCRWSTDASDSPILS